MNIPSDAQHTTLNKTVSNSISHHLRIAAAVYWNDKGELDKLSADYNRSAAYREALERMGFQFKTQAEECESLAEKFEQAISVILTGT